MGSVEQNSKQRLLQYAADQLGAAELAIRLKASQRDVTQWMEGAEMPPREALALADLIGHLHDGKQN